ncbi:MAG: M50 family metallopeptidase, partial [Bacillota bacterium]|nr:M50 family metallopeptidase [Bacillota bacterium]
MFTTIISFIIVFGLIVLFHEGGHFAIAKLNGIKVNEFSIGFGPKFASRKKGETDYSLRVFPIGGFVKMDGEDELSDNPRGFSNQNPYRRLSVIIAGPLMNFILAILLLSIISFNVGVPTTTIDEVFYGKPASLAGILPGDEIKTINDIEIKSWTDVSYVIGKSEDDILITVIRNENLLDFHITPTLEEETDRKIVGIVPAIEKSLLKSVSAGWNQTVYIFESIFAFLGDMISGDEVEGEIIGPVGIVNVIGEAAHTGILPLLFIAAYLSINLG